MNKSVRYIFTSLMLLLTLPAFSGAEHGEAHGEAEGTFNAGHMILEHVQDAHSIHFFTVGHTHITLPLPCIVFGSKGVDIFMSSAFNDEHHNQVPYTAGSGATYVLAGEKIHEVVNGELVKPYDFSITKNVLGLFIGVFLMLWIFLKVARRYKADPLRSPKGVQSFLEPLIIFLRDEVAKPAIGHHYGSFMPYLLTVFFFIFFGNLLGLIPFFGFNFTGNIAVTLVLALLTFFITSFRANKGYWMHIVAPPGVPGWLLPLMIPIELIGVLSKPIVLMLRLFANVTAGHIIILSFVSLIFIFGAKFGTGAGLGTSVLSMVFAIFMNLLELLVAFLQAYVFTLLSALYFGAATEEAHH